MAEAADAAKVAEVTNVVKYDPSFAVKNTLENGKISINSLKGLIPKDATQSFYNFVGNATSFLRGSGDAALSAMTWNVVKRNNPNPVHPISYKAGQILGELAFKCMGSFLNRSWLCWRSRRLCA